MGAESLLESVRCAAVDTSPFIYLFEARPPRQDRAVELFARLESARLVTSIITIIEVFTNCQREGRQDLRLQYMSFFHETPGLEVIGVEWAVAERAAEIRSRYRLRVPDAVQIATGIVEKAEILITMIDGSWRSLKFRLSCSTTGRHSVRPAGYGLPGVSAGAGAGRTIWLRVSR